ncbi:FAD/NADP-binding domain superfamily [Fusarium oxysporum f. sp. vasinfectum]|uniref:Sterigmatocystin biosynthesis monooxygenase stcW n=1 Tax=Fusarium oxysporum f. sp. vasinfectum 25433 TaxID=1089449 RepID=X0KID6_FUSOX|nr:hypothetical protein FOTG_18171 [Fusarium oxysporum f. sp. vasinfectum 25433]KAK2923588.1 FAD/NADP-binding domain superfamily [Fusarium oxysporum f. sp. vasinfectum]KAK2938736.1 FAD/NADP-binding domain superfamily [Fusarium oxysporum f. sp. vasinfectum]
MTLLSNHHEPSKFGADRPIDSAKPLKLVYIGAGVSGIVASIIFRKAIPSLDLVIYDKNPGIGGTWFENKYPGCACDIPSHAYQLSFESSTDWNHFYAGAPEILDYWKRVADKYNVRDNVRLNHKCLEATWDESRAKWKVRLERSDVDPPVIIEDECDVFVTGTGLLNEWKWPAIPGLHDFKGTILHTANWQDSFTADGKRVAVIGAGSSGIQVVPALVSKVKAIDHYVRGKTWIATQGSEDMLKKELEEEGQSQASNNLAYGAEQKKTWRNDPEAYIAYRKQLEFRLQSRLQISYLGSARHNQARASYTAYMREKLKTKPELFDTLLPDFPPLCKRLTPGPGYLEALTQPHVSTITSPISHIEPSGIVTQDGTRRPVDAIVCATGFQTGPESGFPIYGRDGVNLRKKHGIHPKSYLGLATDNFPNFFQSLGPNTFPGTGNLLIMIEHAHHYIAKVLQRLAYGQLRTIEPKRKQVDNFTNFCCRYFDRTVYTEKCESWYKTPPRTPGDKERITALWPGSSIHAIRALSEVRWDDYDIEYVDDDDFGWFGNGSTLGETDPNLDQNLEDLTWYINKTGFLHNPIPIIARDTKL